MSQEQLPEPTLLTLLDTPIFSSRTSILQHILTSYLHAPDVLNISHLNHTLHRDRRFSPNAELWWTLSVVIDTGRPPTRGMRPVERRRDWQRICCEKYRDESKARNQPKAVFLNPTYAARPTEIMEASPVSSQRGKLTAEQKQEARAFYKELRNKKLRGKAPLRTEREFFTV